MSLAISPGLTNRVRWKSHRWVVRQSVTFFQNDFAGRIAQKVMQTGHALRRVCGQRESTASGRWRVYLIGTLALFCRAGLAPDDPGPRVGGGLRSGDLGDGAARAPPLAALRRPIPPSPAGSSTATANIQSVKLFAHAER